MKSPVVSHTCNPSTKRAERGEVQVQGQLGSCAKTKQKRAGITTKVILFPGLEMTALPTSSKFYVCAHVSLQAGGTYVGPKSMKPHSPVIRTAPWAPGAGCPCFPWVNVWRWCQACNPGEATECWVVRARELVTNAASWDFTGGAHLSVLLSDFNPGPFV